MGLISPNSSSEALHGWAALEGPLNDCLSHCSPAAPIALIQVHFRHWQRATAAHGLLLSETALEGAERRIVEALRPGDHLLRSGSGDFFVVLPKLLGLGHAELAAQRILRDLDLPLSCGGREMYLLPTLALAMATDPTETPDSFQRRTSSALIAGLRDGALLRIAAPYAEDAMAAALRDALARNALDLVFQPIVSLPEARTVGYEALARWTREAGEAVAPSVFIPMAEDAGLAAELTRWTLQVALREFSPLHRQHPEAYCAINLSARAFDDAALADQIIAALAIWDLPPQCLMIEVTETAVLHDVGRNAEALQRLAEMGVRIAVDDFGQGYSSLGYLRHLPAAILKIDQSFVADSGSPRTRALLEAITRMTHGLGMRAVAEGVEDEIMLGAVLEAGCDFAQGYFFARPAPASHWIEAIR